MIMMGERLYMTIVRLQYPREESLDGIDELLETSTSFRYLQLTKECIKDVFQ